MTHGNRWAAVFVNSLDKDVQRTSDVQGTSDAEAGLACLKALVQPIRAVPGMFGYAAARRLEAMLRSVVSDSGAGPAKITEYAIRFIVLIVEKKQLKNVDDILQKIEDRIDEQKKALAVTIESATPDIDNVFKDRLRQDIIKWTGAAELKIKTRLVPDLLGGYRLRIGGFFIDASLKGQIEKMKGDLSVL